MKRYPVPAALVTIGMMIWSVIVLWWVVRILG